jgi:hypothetical protein
MYQSIRRTGEPLHGSGLTSLVISVADERKRTAKSFHPFLMLPACGQRLFSELPVRFHPQIAAARRYPEHIGPENIWLCPNYWQLFQ